MNLPLRTMYQQILGQRSVSARALMAAGLYLRFPV